MRTLTPTEVDMVKVAGTGDVAIAVEGLVGVQWQVVRVRDGNAMRAGCGRGGGTAASRGA